MGLHGRCMPPTACPFTAWVTGSQKPVRSRRPLRGGKKGRRASVRLVFQNDPGCQFHVLRQQCDSALRVTCDGGLGDVVVLGIQMGTVKMDGQHTIAFSTEERRVGKGGVSKCRSRWAPDL